MRQLKLKKDETKKTGSTVARPRTQRAPSSGRARDVPWVHREAKDSRRAGRSRARRSAEARPRLDTSLRDFIRKSADPRRLVVSSHRYQYQR